MLLTLLFLGLLNLFSLLGLLLGLALVLGLRRKAGNEPSNTSLVLAVFRVLARADGFGETSASLEDHQENQDTNSSPLGIRLGAVAVPQIQC